MSQTGADLIKIERMRQIVGEEYKPAGDIGREWELIRAGVLYADNAAQIVAGLPNLIPGAEWTSPLPEDAPNPWPWEPRYFKPTGDVKRDLVKAGALIAAAIDVMIAEENLVAEQMATYDSVTHRSDCALHSEPAYPAKPCNCGALSQ